MGRRSKNRSKTFNTKSLHRRLRVELLEDRRMLAVFSVDNLNDSGTGSLRDAIVQANGAPGADTIDFSAGLSGGTIALSTGELEVTETLTIDASSLAAHVTIDAQQLSRVFNFTVTGGDFNLTGLTIQNGKTTGDNTARFTDNTNSGGGIRFLSFGTVTLTGSTVSGNRTEGDWASGGGIFTDNGNVTLIDSSVSGNATLGSAGSGLGSGAVGGGIGTFGGTITLTDSILSNNSTEGFAAHGGGIHTLHVPVTLINSTVSGNSTSGDFAFGGAIYTLDGPVTVTQSTISGNSTAGDSADGGGIHTRGTAITVTYSTVTGNRVTGNFADGGGIFIDNGNTEPPLTILSSIIAENTAALGVGPDFVPDPEGLLTVEYSLIGDNDATGLIESQSPDANGNLIGSAAGAGIIDPLLGPLANNGGPTETHEIFVGSPAISAGDPTAFAGVGATPEFDQRGIGFPRVSFGHIDIGATEFEQNLPPQGLIVDITTDESDGDFSVGDLSLREAVLLANANPGTDTISFDPSLSGQSILLSGTELEVTEALTIDASSLAANVTIDAQQLSRVINFTATVGDFSLTSLTIQNGKTTGDRGGGIRFLSSGTLTLTKSTVSGNSAGGNGSGGGGIFTDFGAVSLNDSSVSGNASLGDGGGISSLSGAITLTNSLLSNNGTTGFGTNGGGIYASNAPVMLIDSTLSGNSTTGEVSRGGGIYTRSGIVTLTRSVVSGNSTSGFRATGGGIDSRNSSVTLTDSTVSGNSTSGDRAQGGGIRTYLGDITLVGSTISGNSTSGVDSQAGGLRSSYGDISLLNSTVSGNTTSGASAWGGGIRTWEGDLTLINSTVVGNSTTGTAAHGGGIYVRDSAVDASLTILNSIIADNTVAAGSLGPDFVPDPQGLVTIDYSLIGENAGTSLTESQTPDANGNLIGSVAGSGIIDPLLGPLADNGGLTETHATLTGSPAINAGDPTAVAGVGDTPEFDQRGMGFSRIGFGRIDMGATEQTLIVDIAADESDGDFSVGDLSLREAILLANSTLGADTISFAPNLSGQTILLGGTELEVTETLTIDASSLAAHVTIDAQQLSRVFNFTATVGDFDLTSLTIQNGKTTADNVNYVDNTQSGGGIRFLSSGNLTITGSTVSGNSTEGGRAKGGGIFTEAGAVRLANSTVSGNSTTGTFGHGGGIHAGSGSVTVAQSTISGNSTTGNFSDGGGILTESGSVTLTHSTLSGNRAEFGFFGGGGISMRDSASDASLTILNSIVAGNTGYLGKGDDLVPDPESLLTVEYSLIGDNSGTSLVESQTPDANGNLIGSAAGAGIIDPLLTPLANNGGPTETHSLSSGSPAFNGGDPTAVAGVGDTPLFDQRGNGLDRVTDGRIDMGATEFNLFVPPQGLIVDIATDESDGNFSVGDLSLREAVLLANVNLGHNTISFDPSLSGQSILLSGTELEVTAALTIDASSLAANVTIDAQQLSRVFNFSATAGDFNLTSLTIQNGKTTADGADGGGGGIRSNGTLTLTGSTVSGNRTVGEGATGGGISSIGSVTLIDSTVSGNSTAGDGARGGGIFSTGSVTLINSTLSGNSTSGNNSDGGGILSFSFDPIGGVTLIHSTVTDNHSNQGGGGGVWEITNPIFGIGFIVNGSIVAGNTAGVGDDDIFTNSVAISINYSLIGDNEGTGLTEAPVGTPDANGNLIGGPVNGIIDPLLGLLANNGGPTETHALLPGSPAIDAGDLNFSAPPDFDQRGAPFVRVFGGRIDFGAFEVQATADSADFDGDNDIDGADFLAWQRGFGTSNASPGDGDANGDLAVDAADLTVWQDQFGTTNASLASAGAPLVDSPPLASAPEVAFAPLFIDAAFDGNKLEEDERDALSVSVPSVLETPRQRVFAQFIPPTVATKSTPRRLLTSTEIVTSLFADDDLLLLALDTSKARPVGELGNLRLSDTDEEESSETIKSLEIALSEF